jgi:hypothetical protein
MADQLDLIVHALERAIWRPASESKPDAAEMSPQPSNQFLEGLKAGGHPSLSRYFHAAKIVRL